MSSFPKPLVDLPENELNEQIKLKRDKMLDLGYDVKHLVVVENGEVLFDPTLSDADAFAQAAAKSDRGSP